MAMKKIKPQYGKVIAPVVDNQENGEASDIDPNEAAAVSRAEEKKPASSKKRATESKETDAPAASEKSVSRTSDPNPFLQTREVFGKARLTKIGYRMRTDYVEILDIIKKIKKGGYTLEAVLDDALTFYFENSEDGREAIKKAEIFYS